MTTPADAGTVAEAGRLLGRAAEALSAYAGQFVLAGGLVPILYREMPRFRSPEYNATATKDIDIVVPRRLARSGSASIPDCLSRARFVRVTVPSPQAGGPEVEDFQDESASSSCPFASRRVTGAPGRRPGWIRSSGGSAVRCPRASRPRRT